MKCDAETFAQMYAEIYNDMYRFALCMMRNKEEAEDVVSDAVVSAYEHIHTLRRPESFKSWTFTILANTCRRRLKDAAKGRAGYRAADTYIREPSECPDYGMEVDIHRAFDVLSDEERAIVGLSVFGGYHSKEIGGLLHLNPNTVRSKRSRALEKMSYLLK